MRTAAICPTCSTYENALCVIYNGEYLPNTDIQPLDSVQVALEKIDVAISEVNGNGPRPVITVTGDYTITNNDYCILYSRAVAPVSSPSITLPSAIDNIGREFIIANMVVNGYLNLITILSQNIKQYYGDVPQTSFEIAPAKRCRVISDGSDWIVTGYNY